MKKKIGLIGGDKRITCLYNMVKRDISHPEAYFMDVADSKNKLPQMFDLDVLIGPVPLCKPVPLLNAKEGFYADVYEIVNKMKPGSVFTAGIIPKELKEFASEQGVSTFDYAATEEFQILNAEITAEGTVKIALGNGNKTLKDAKVLVLGYGRIGKALCNVLTGFHGDFTVTARKVKDLSYIQINGYKGIHTDDIKQVISEFDIIINTIPAPILTKDVLECVKEDAFIIDLASIPGGTDFEYAQKRGIKAEHALSIPGKFFHYSASSVIYKILCEKSILESE